MTILKKIGLYMLFFILSTATVCGVNVLSFMVSRQPSTEEMVDDGFLTSFIGQFTSSNDISADIDLTTTYNSEQVGLKGIVKVLMPKEDNNQMELSLNCVVDSNNKQIPLQAIIKDGNLFLNFNGAKVIIQTTDALKDINSITAGIGLGLNFDFIKMFDIGAIMDSLASLKAEPIKNGYCAKLVIEGLGTINMYLDEKYNLKKAELENVEISGATVNLNANINIDDEDFVIEDIPMQDDSQKDLTQVINFVKAVTDTFGTEQFATDVNIQLGNFNINATVGIDATSDIKAYVKTNLLGKDLLVVCDNKEAFINFDNLKVKINYSELGSALNVILEKYMPGIDISDLPKYIRDKIVSGLDELAKSGSPIYDIISYIADFDIAALLTRFEYDEVEEALVIKIPNDIDVSLKKKDEKIFNVVISAENFDAVATIVNYDTTISIDKTEYVDYTHYKDITNGMMQIIDTKQAQLNIDIVINNKVYNADMCIDLMSSQIVSLKTVVEDFNIYFAVEDDYVYVSVNDIWVKYHITTETENLLLQVVDIVNDLTGLNINLQTIQETINNLLSDTANGEVIVGDINIDNILNGISKLKLQSVTNEKMHFVYDGVSVIFGLEEDNLLSLQVIYKDYSAKAILKNLPTHELIESDKYVDISLLDTVSQSIIDFVKTKQIALNGSVNYNGTNVPVELLVDLNVNEYALSFNVLNIPVQIAVKNNNAYLLIDNLKYKMSVLDIEKLVQEYLGINVLSQVNELSLTEKIADVLKNITLKNVNDKIMLTFNDIVANLSVVNNKPNFNLNAFGLDVNFAVDNYRSIEIYDNEYEEFANYEQVLNTILDVVENKNVKLNLQLNYNNIDINAIIFADFCDGLKLEVQTSFGEYNIKLVYVNNCVYILVNNLKLNYIIPEQLNPLIDTIKQIYFDLTGNELELPDVDQTINNLLQKTEINSQDFISNLITEIKKLSISVNNNKISVAYLNDLTVDVLFNTQNILQIIAEYKGVNVVASLNSSNNVILVPEQTININKLIDKLPAIASLVNKHKFQISGTVNVADYNFNVVANVDISDLSNIKVKAQIVVDSLTLDVTMVDNLIYISFKGLNLCVEVGEIKDLLLNDVKNFIKENLQDTIDIDKIIEEINQKLISLDLLEDIIVDDAVKFVTAFGLNISFVIDDNNISAVEFNYQDLANGQFNLLPFAEQIVKPEGEFTNFKTALKIANGLIDFIKEENFNVAFSVNSGSTNVELVANVQTIMQEDARIINKITANVKVNDDITVQMLYQNNYIYVDVNGLLVKLDLSCVANLVGVVTSLLGVDLSPIYDLINVDIPGFDTDVLKDLMPKVDESAEKQSIFDMLESIQLSPSGDRLTIRISGGQEFTITTKQVEDKLLLNSFVFDNVVDQNALSVVANFYSDKQVECNLSEELDYIDLSSLASFLKVLENTYNLKHYKLQGTASLNLELGSIKSAVNIDVYANIKVVKQENGEWKPYIEALLNLPCANYNMNTIGRLAFESEVTGNDAQNHIAKIALDGDKLYIYRTVYKKTGLFSKTYKTEVRDNVSYSLSDLSNNATLVNMLIDILGGSNTLKLALNAAFKAENRPEDGGIDKYIVHNDKYEGYYYDETDSKYKIVLDGEYVISNSSIGYLFINIKDEQREDGKKYLSELDFTMHIGSTKDDGQIRVNLNGLKLLKENQSFTNNWNNSNAYDINSALNQDLENMINAGSFQEFWSNIS